MRVLFSGIPAYGHLLPMLPTAQAAQRAGEQVALSTSASMAAVAGHLPFVPAGPELMWLAAESARRNNGASPADLADIGPAVELFGTVRIERGFEPVRAAFENFGPDLIVAENTDLVAPLAAAALGVPWVAHSTSIEMFPPLRRGYDLGVARQAARLGLRPTARVAVVEFWPEWLQAPYHVPAPDAVAVRPAPFARPGDGWSAPRFPGRDDRPLVLVTLGTVVDTRSRIGDVLRALSAVDANLLVTAGPVTPPESIAADPARVRVISFIPLAELLPAVDAVVTTGGAGTVLSALSCGLPMVVMPVLADQPLIGEQVEAAGAGMVVRDLRAGGSSEQLAEALGRILQDPGYRDAAQREAKRIAGLPAPDEAWAGLRRQLAAR
jgi:UDP:flavonoid glycosyltransferase YjiC (YdhE family)